ncbi:MAG: hypothetical protein CMG66_01745 [Candidatus Marinimicrobia bacterium]|nr:hypothetical protein [Candidatus Neomarinimicrobiota bacterium]|tara:strand:+ start:6460 stop:9702 length:3243 start_codon:yes stop_codon:yes gene_type:complete
MYKMPFVQKNFLYVLPLFVLLIDIGQTSAPIEPYLLLQNDQGYQFYSFENKALSLHNINNKSETTKIWEYKFLQTKEARLVSLLHGDIKGDSKKEIIAVLHSFGQQGEVYIFSMKDNIPFGPPEILKIPTEKTGTTPAQAKLINWDRQKKQEILLACSSPERELLVLDYYNNNLKIIKTLASDFMSSTYGPIKFFTTDVDQDKADDVIIYSTKETLEEHIVFSSSPAVSNIIRENINFSTLTGVQNKQNFFILGNKQNLDNTAYSLLEKEDIKIPLGVSGPVSLVALADSGLVVLSNKQKLFFMKENKIKKITTPPFISTQTQYIIDKQNTAALFFSKKENKQTLVMFNSQKPNPLVNTAKEKKTQTKEYKTTIHDTLFINVEQKLIVPILKPDALNIESIETQKKPEGMSLNSKSLEFVWSPTRADTGIYSFQYLANYVSDATLEEDTSNNAQLKLKKTFKTTTEMHEYFIYVNDFPQLIINNPLDTIHTTGFFQSSYNVVDYLYQKKPTLQVVNPKNNNLLINDNEIYWEPSRLDFGMKNFLVFVDDGMAQDTANISVFIDTTIIKTQENMDFIITVNEPFTYQIPHQKGVIYKKIKTPQNLRISTQGTIYWVPIMTQVDMNSIIIKAESPQNTKEYILNVYVNAVPVISSQPAEKEYIQAGKNFTFQFQSFDMNANPELQWAYITNDTLPEFMINQFGLLSFDTTNKIDNFTYIITLNDRVDKDEFIGKLYVNETPKIISTPDTHVEFGGIYQYVVQAEDRNTEKPYQENKKNQLYYDMPVFPQGTSFDKTTQTITWKPTEKQIGKNNFSILVTDSIDFVTQDFSVFVNDKPSIVGPDSLKIMLGDTLFHYFDAQDLNQDSELLYTIKTTIDEILFSGKTGKLVWIPKEEDLGFHTLEISVSDGFHAGTDRQKINIFVYKNPVLLNTPMEKAFVNIDYIFNPKGEDMFLDSLFSKDLFLSILSSDTMFTGQTDSLTQNLRWKPTISEVGEHTLTFNLIDKYKNTQKYTFPIKVDLSPCETIQQPCEGLDTLIINKTDTIEKTIIDSIFIEKKDTIFIEKNKKIQNNTKEWKPRGLGF